MLQSHIILSALWIVFCVLHSLLADTQIKKRLSATSFHFAKNYRFFYTLFAFVSLGVVIYYQWKLASPVLFTTSSLTRMIGAGLSLLGMVLMLICIKKYFLSLSGIKSLVAEQTVVNELRIDGVHQYVRHPLYLGTFIFIWGLWVWFPFLSLLISNVIITIYTLIGIQLEEKKLIDEFGDHYVKYRSQVPMIFPTLKNLDNNFLKS